MSDVEYTPPAFGVSDGTVNGDLTVGGDVELGSGGPTITTGTQGTEPAGSIFLGSGGSVSVSKSPGVWRPLIDADAGGLAQHSIAVATSANVLGDVAGFTFDGSTFTTPNVELTSGGPTITTGTGSPEGAVTAPVGSMYTNTSGGAGTTLYVKETAPTGNTGWVGK